MVADRDLEWVKYANFASPVAAGWLAAKTIEVNLLLGVFLSSYVVLWMFANSTGLLVILQANWSVVKARDPKEVGEQVVPPKD